MRINDKKNSRQLSRLSRCSQSYKNEHDGYFERLDPGEGYVIDTTEFVMGNGVNKIKLILLNTIDHFSKYAYS